MYFQDTTRGRLDESRELLHPFLLKRTLMYLFKTMLFKMECFA